MWSIVRNLEDRNEDLRVPHPAPKKTHTNNPGIKEKLENDRFKR